MTTTTTDDKRVRQPLRIAYTERYLDWQLGAGHPTNPMRAKLAVDLLRGVLDADAVNVHGPGRWYRYMGGMTSRLLGSVHTDAYLHEVINDGRSGEWEGVNHELAQVAMTMAQGTLMAFTDIETHDYDPRVWFNPQGAKHHAQADGSSGFCVFNDMAAVATLAANTGKRVLYLDWDVHRGDGVEALTRDNDRVMTASIQGEGMFAGAGDWEPERHVYNWAILAGQGDLALHDIVDFALARAEVFRPDLVLVAAGADGLKGDPLGNLAYSIEGVAHAGAMVGRWAGERDLPVIIGGAGGYTPLGNTPVAWAAVASSLWNAHCEALERG